MFGICIINLHLTKRDPGTVKVGTKNDKYLPHLFTKENFINLPTGGDFLVKVVTKNYKCLPHLGTGCPIKTDEFSEKFQKFILQILDL